MKLKSKMNNEVSKQTLLQAVLRRDLGAFVVKVFHTLCPEDRYYHNWHIEAVVYALMQVYLGKDKRLVITQPPRSLKSICTWLDRVIKDDHVGAAAGERSADGDDETPPTLGRHTFGLGILAELHVGK